MDQKSEHNPLGLKKSDWLEKHFCFVHLRTALEWNKQVCDALVPVEIFLKRLCEAKQVVELSGIL